MEITVNVTGIDGVDLNTPITTYNENQYGERVHITQTLGDLVAEKIVKAHGYNDDLRRRILAIRADVIRELILPDVQQAMTEPIHRTNEFGERIGSETTLRVLIMDEVKKLIAPRDRVEARETIVQKVIREEVASVFTKEVRDAVKEEREKVVKAVRDRAAIILSDAVRDGLKQV